MLKEIFKDIPWYEWLYQVNNIWEVKSLPRIKKNHQWKHITKERLLKPWLTIHGYKQVSLSKKGTKIFRVHRLVAAAFMWLNLYEDKKWKHWTCVCHKNDIRTDNRIENLFIGTHKDNMVDMKLKWRAPKPSLWKKWKLAHNSKKVKQYTKDWVFVKLWHSMADIERQLGILTVSISYVCNWKRKTAWWYIWKFI